MSEKELIRGATHFFYAFVMCLIMMFDSNAYAHDNPGTSDASCATSNLRTDIRPGVDGPPTKISVGIRMLDLIAISDIDQKLDGDFVVILSWIDPRLSQLEGCRVPIEDVWSPELVFGNSGRRFTSLKKEVSIGPEGHVKYAQRFSGSFSTRHELKDFPFDKQTFQIYMLSLEWPEKDVQLIVDEEITGRRSILNVPNWIVGEVEGIIGREYFEALDFYTSRYDFNISAQRIEDYYWWKMIMPLCLIVAMSWCVFWINPAQYGPQIGISATSMLTLIAFIFATTNMVPQLGYLTLLDRFIMRSTVLVFLALVESLLTIYLVSNQKKETACRVDLFSRWLFPVAFGAIIVSVFFH